jgi:hypothetical protein
VFSQWCYLTVDGLLATVSVEGSGSPRDTSVLADMVAVQRDLLTG